MSDITLAVSESALRKIFNNARDNFQFEKQWDWNRRSTFQVRGHVKAHLEGGDIGLYNPGLLHPHEATVGIKKLDIIWDKLDLQFGINIPEVCIGGQCVIPTPWGCAVRLPRKCFFSGNPDIISPWIKLGKVFRSEISMNFAPITNHTLPRPSKWEVKLKPLWHDFDLVDVADTIGDLLDRLVNYFVDELLSFLPGWAKDIIKWIFGNLIKLIRSLLDLADDIEEWLSKILNVSIGTLDFLIQMIYQLFDLNFKVFELDDPYEILETKGNLDSVRIPIDSVNINVDTSNNLHKELVAELNIKNI